MIAKSPTFILIITMVSVFILQNTFDIDYLAFTPALALQRPWTFVTSMFLHADVSHILFNMFALFFFGIYLERFISMKEYMLLFFASGIVGNIGYMLTAVDSTIPVIGASGGIYGIMGCLATLRPYAIVYIYFAPMPLILAAGLWAVSEFLGLFVPSYIAHGSHLFGLLIGFFFGLYMRKRLNIIK